MDELWVPLKDAKLSNKVDVRLKTEVVEVDHEGKELSLKAADGKTSKLKYDYMVLAAGIKSDGTKVPGVADNMLDICNWQHTEKITEAINNCQGGETIVFATSRAPYKCPPAPFEYVFLIDEMLTNKGIRDSCRIVLTTPKKPFPFGNDRTKEVFVSTMEKKNIEFIPGFQVAGVRGDDKAVDLESFGPGDKETRELKYDVLVGTWPQLPVAPFRPLCNDKGYVAADVRTMETKFEGVFAVGDVSWMMLPSTPPKPHPKAGGFAIPCAENACAMIEALIGGDSLEEARKKVPEGRKAVCYAESGFETGIVVGPKLLPDSDGPPGFLCEHPTEEAYHNKSKWIADIKERFFGAAAVSNT